MKGFTLAEMLLVVTIIVILSLIGTPLFSRLIMQTSVTRTAEQIVATMRKAQSYAMSDKQNSNWGVTYTGGNMVLFSGTTYATRTAAFDETTALNPNIAITGFTETVFLKPTGNVAAPVTINLTEPERSETITVNTQGVVSR